MVQDKVLQAKAPNLNTDIKWLEAELSGSWRSRLPGLAAVKLSRQTIHPLHAHLKFHMRWSQNRPLLDFFPRKPIFATIKPESAPQKLGAPQHHLAWRDAPQSRLLWTPHTQTWPENKSCRLLHILDILYNNLSGSKLFLVPFKPGLEHNNSNHWGS